MDNIIVIDDFLPNTLSDIVLQESENLSWRPVNDSAGVEKNYDNSDRNIIQFPQLTHLVCENNQPTSDLHPLIMAMIWFFEDKTQITPTGITRVKFNYIFQTNCKETDYAAPHVDNPSDDCVSMIYYLHDADGQTRFFDKTFSEGYYNLNIVKEITPKKNTAVIFPSNLFHASAAPMNYPSRKVINFVLPTTLT